jgi:hypothetical protein
VSRKRDTPSRKPRASRRRAPYPGGREERGLILEAGGKVTYSRLPSDFRDQQYEELVQTVLRGIEIIKARGDKATLLDVRAACEREGIKPGPKRQQRYSAWKIETLRNLARPHAKFEDAITHPARKRAPESARQELWRYCRELYRWCMLANLHTPEDWQKPKAAKVFREQFGLQFPRDLDAASEAYGRGKKTFEKHLAVYDRFLELDQPPTS